MFAINRTTMRDSYKNEDRIGDLEVKDDYLEFQLKVEDFIESHSLLPVTFDVAQCQPPFFSEYTYTDYAGGVWIKSLSAEFNSRYLMTLPKDNTGQLIFREKYELSRFRDDKDLEEKDNRTIIFLAGTNLFNQICWELVDRIIYFNDKALIKPHPLTNDEGLKKVGNRYGWHHLIGVQESGYYWFEKASKVYATSNSELFVRAMLTDKYADCINYLEKIPKSSYFSFFILNKEGYKANEIKSVILDEASGIVFPHQADWKERLLKYFEKSFEFRKQFQSHVPTFLGNI
jgi:hypothetical protein